MKSIKEKAEEYVDHYYQKLGISKDEYPTDVVISKADFEAGANYVLDAIIECIPKTYSFNSNEAIDIIVSRIKQLKSNQ